MPLQRHDPLRRLSGPCNLDARRQALAECHVTLAAIEAVDQQLGALAAERRALVAKLHEQREFLMPRFSDRKRARQPAPDGAALLPPVQHDHTPLWGRRLRGTCLAILRRSGRLSLVELHVLLHHHGYRVQGAHPVKALADALAYESEQGRARRTARGVYEITSAGSEFAARRGSLDPTGEINGRLDHLAETAPHAA